MDNEIQYENFKKVIDFIGQKSPFQKKVVNRLFENADEKYLSFAEDFSTRMLNAIDRGESHEYLATAYLNYTKSIRIEEMYFAKEKKYRFSDYDKVYDQVYSRDDYMFDYVVGLGMTQLFWPNHYAIVRFFLDEFIPLVKGFKSGAEVGVGHGLFHSEFLRGASDLNTKMLDISPISLEMTKRMIKATGIDPIRAEACLCDVQKEIPIDDGSLDGLLMGELVEHIQDGHEVMSAISGKMKKSGICFFTTACNSPAEDHILLFRTIKEVHKLIEETGWKVKKEHIGTLNNMSVKEAEKDGHNINYAAILAVQ